MPRGSDDVAALPLDGAGTRVSSIVSLPTDHFADFAASTAADDNVIGFGGVGQIFEAEVG